MGIEAEKKYQKTFTLNDMISNYLSLYKNLM